MIAENGGRNRNRPQRVKAGENIRKGGDSRKAPQSAEQRLLLKRSVQYQTTLAQNVRILRTAAGMSQQALADALGWFRTTIIRIETGETCPSFAQACVIAEIFGVPVDSLSKDLSWMYSMNNAGTLTDALRTIRLQENLSQEDVAGQCGISRTEYGMIESGKKKADAAMLAKLSKVLGRPIVFGEAG